MLSLVFLLVVLFSLSWYLRKTDRLISRLDPEAVKFAQKPWTKEQISARYRELQASPPDFSSCLYSKQNRRYVVTGGSGESPMLVDI